MAGLLTAVLPAEAAPRFFASSAQCENARVLAPGECRTAFANATAEFAAKAPSFPSRRACFKQFGPCMPWPVGTRRYDTFRPQLIGATVDGVSVLPALAPGRVHLDFAPQSPTVLSPQAAHATPLPAVEPAVTILSPKDDAEADPGPAPHAGSGFTIIDGVLTYPAPARFQPKNLKHP